MKSLPEGQLFYAPGIEGRVYVFDTFESGHLVKVLRKKPGDRILLTDGQGHFYTAVITTATPRRVAVEILESRYVPPPSKKLHVYIAPTKQIDRFEWFLEKATELGVWEITPVRTVRTERKKLNFERLEKIIISALKQSLRAYKPVLHNWTSLTSLQGGEGSFAALCQATPGDGRDFGQHPRSSVVIGPEGGFTDEEIDILRQKGFKPLFLSPNRLRTETAGITAVCKFYS